MSVQSELKKFNDKIRADFVTKKGLSKKKDILLDKMSHKSPRTEQQFAPSTLGR